MLDPGVFIWARPQMVNRKSMKIRNFVKAEVPGAPVRRRAVLGFFGALASLPDDDCSGLTQAPRRFGPLGGPFRSGGRFGGLCLLWMGAARPGAQVVTDRRRFGGGLCLPWMAKFCEICKNFANFADFSYYLTKNLD